MPTADQLEWFKKKGCVSRCLIKVREIQGKPITLDDFCSAYEQYFTNQLDSYGMLEGMNMGHVVAKLGLPHLSAIESDFDKAKNAWNSGRTVLLSSEINLDAGATDPVKHCSLIQDMTDTSFEAWSPLKDGSETIFKFLRRDWQDKICRGLVLG